MFIGDCDPHFHIAGRASPQMSDQAAFTRCTGFHGALSDVPLGPWQVLESDLYESLKPLYDVLAYTPAT